jgi:hypothetical protein
MQNLITKERLEKAKPDNVRRLASWLKIDTHKLSIEEVIEIVYNRIYFDKALRIK